MAKVAIIGGGHNGLVAAFYLSRSGHDVHIFEREPEVGGACRSLRQNCGCLTALGAEHFGMLLPCIIEDLELEQRGLEVYPYDPTLVAVFPSGRYLAVWQDPAATSAEIAKFSRHDARAYPNYLEHLHEAADTLRTFLVGRPPTLEKVLSALERRGRGFGHRFLLGSLYDAIRHYFKHPEVQGALMAGAVLFRGSPRAPGTAFALPYLAQAGRWGAVKGGMTALASLMAQAVLEAGGTIETSAPVHAVRVENGRAVGVDLGDRYFEADIVFSNADPITTFTTLPSPPDFRYKIIDLAAGAAAPGACAKLNLLARRAPSFTALSARPQLFRRAGMVVVCPSLTFLEAAYDDCLEGRLSASPYMEIFSPALHDPTVRCADHTPVSVYLLYAPYSDTQLSPAEREEATSSILTFLDSFAPGFSSNVVKSELYLPRDLELSLHLFKGNVDQGNMQPGNLFAQRSAVAHPHFGEISDLVLCGAAAHPGGLVMGASGQNAAMRWLFSRTVNLPVARRVPVARPATNDDLPLLVLLDRWLFGLGFPTFTLPSISRFYSDFPSAFTVLASADSILGFSCTVPLSEDGVQLSRSGRFRSVVELPKLAFVPAFAQAAGSFLEVIATLPHLSPFDRLPLLRSVALQLRSFDGPLFTCPCTEQGVALAERIGLRRLNPPNEIGLFGKDLADAI